MEQNTKKGIAFAVLAAALYAINAPFSKLLLEFVPPTLMAGFLYIGAGVGMMVIAFIKKGPIPFYIRYFLPPLPPSGFFPSQAWRQLCSLRPASGRFFHD